MTAPSLKTLTLDGFRLREPITWRDDDINCTLVISQPATDPDLWAQYSAGAHHSYGKHGVECALDSDALRTGDDTLVYFAVLNDAGQMLAGVRGIGPLRSAEDSHAVVEWAGQPAQQAVRSMINDRVPFGVVEMKSAWVVDEGDQDRCLSAALARTAGHVTALLDVQFCMATAAAYVLNRWRSIGCVVAGIPAAPYPNERYQTKMMWFDRRDFVNHANDSRQVAKMISETRYLTQEYDRQWGTEDRVLNRA